MKWSAKAFSELTTVELYDIFRLRVDVFVVEQECPYPEIDGFDMTATHLYCKENGQYLAYARLIPAGEKYEEASIGRVLVPESVRGNGAGRELVAKSIEYITEEWGEERIKIQAQSYLKDFYGSFGFKPISGEYDEDGIPHFDMLFTKI